MDILCIPMKIQGKSVKRLFFLNSVDMSYAWQYKPVVENTIYLSFKQQRKLYWNPKFPEQKQS